ncbi:hypothetical protein ACSDR0_37760 [Streptosporangium sp. G11]|uniref:hypothetical protein n=1 Tax=Streptosporangium sp. G11 TaxID=3436926 RepID=UPI003EBDAFB2
MHTARMVFMYSPGGPEGMFLDMGDDPRAGEQPRAWGPEKVAEVLPTLARYQTDVLPDPD